VEKHSPKVNLALHLKTGTNPGRLFKEAIQKVITGTNGTKPIEQSFSCSAVCLTIIQGASVGYEVFIFDKRKWNNGFHDIYNFGHHCWMFCHLRGMVPPFGEAGEQDGSVVRALASHQCGPDSNPGLCVRCGLSLSLILFLALRGFSPGTPVFPSQNFQILIAFSIPGAEGSWALGTRMIPIDICNAHANIFTWNMRNIN